MRLGAPGTGLPAVAKNSSGGSFRLRSLIRLLGSSRKRERVTSRLARAQAASRRIPKVVGFCCKTEPIVTDSNRDFGNRGDSRIAVADGSPSPSTPLSENGVRGDRSICQLRLRPRPWSATKQPVPVTFALEPISHRPATSSALPTIFFAPSWFAVSAERPSAIMARREGQPSASVASAERRSSRWPGPATSPTTGNHAHDVQSQLADVEHVVDVNVGKVVDGGTGERG